MKILKESATFEVLSKPEDVINNIATAARVCKGGEKYADREKNLRLVKNLRDIGHDPMLEFGDMIVKFDMISRGFTHEGVRHRLCSFAQNSTRYVDQQEFLIISSPHYDETEQVELDISDIENLYLDGVTDFSTMNLSPEQFGMLIEKLYKALRVKGWKPEDCRQFLPIGIRTTLIWKANMQEWRHIFYRRCHETAHWEIREIMCDLLLWCKENIPIIFDDFYFFKTEENKRYARKIMSIKKLCDELSHYLKINKNNFSDLDKINEVFRYL